MSQKRITTIAVAFPSENLDPNFCLIEWLIRFLEYVEKNNIGLDFFRLTPSLGTDHFVDFTVMNLKTFPPFLIVMEFSFLSNMAESHFVLENFIRNSLVDQKTNFTLVNNQESVNRFSRSQPLLYYCVVSDKKNLIDFSYSSFFEFALKSPTWSLTLSCEWKKFLFLRKKDSALIPGDRGFLELPQYIEISSFGPEFETRLSQRSEKLLLNSLFNPSFLHNIFSTLVTSKNLHYLNFQEYQCIFDSDTAFSIVPVEMEGFSCSVCEGRCHLYKSCHAYQPDRGEHYWDSDLKELPIPSSED